MRFIRYPHHSQRLDRKGSALLVVLVLVVLLPLSAYLFSDRMITEVQATRNYGHDTQARLTTDSAVEYLVAILGNKESYNEVDFLNNQQLFFSVPLNLPQENQLQYQFSIVTVNQTSSEPDAIRFGVTNESSKINLNALVELEAGLKLDPEVTRGFLMEIPQMSESVADSILDWIDEDQERRPDGAEAESYVQYTPMNGPLSSLDTLLLVQGVTPELLYGEDANRNQLLDPNEDDGEMHLPLDNADGTLQLGWSAYFTLTSNESNLRKDGTERINLNQSTLTDLYDELIEEFDEETAQFIVAYRMEGPSHAGAEESESGTGTSNGSRSGSSGSGNSSDLSADQEQAVQKFAQDIAVAVLSGSGSITRGGLDLSRGGGSPIKSIYDLIDAEVEVEVDGTRQTLVSPWSSDVGDLQENIPFLSDVFAVSAEDSISGRINIIQAREEILLGIPDMTTEITQAILAKQQMLSQGGSTTSYEIDRTSGWLLTEGVVDLSLMRKLDPYLTAGGDVYSAQILGHDDRNGPVRRVEVVIDCGKRPAQLFQQRELSHLGRGYRWDKLDSGDTANSNKQNF